MADAAADAGPHPAVVLVHGLGATHDMMLAQYEQHFAAAGIATLAFDYRTPGLRRSTTPTYFGATPVPGRYGGDRHLDARADIDSARIGLWGTSLGRMNVIRVAAARDDVAVAVVQCPIVHGPGAARRLGLFAVAAARAGDRRRPPTPRNATRPPPRADCGTAGSLAMVTVEGAEAGWNSTVPPGAAVRQPHRRRRCRGHGGDIGDCVTPAMSRRHCWSASATART